MVLENIIRGIVKKHPELKLKLKRANSKLTPFQYVYQSITMSFMTFFAFAFVVFAFFKSNILYAILGVLVVLLLSPLFYIFWFSVIDVLIKKYSRELESDLLFVSEFFLVSLESGLPLGNAIKRLAKLNRPGGKFFARIFTEFKTGKDLETALEEASVYSASDSMKILLKRLKDSLNIGIDLKTVLVNFIHESSERKILDIKSYSKKLNPILMMYLLIGIVLPSLGITFFILGAAIMEITPNGLGLILGVLFIFMFLFQYFSYSAFKFGKSTI